MTDFNSYMGNIDTDFFRELCLRNGELRYYKRNEFILREGEVGSFFGFIVGKSSVSCPLKPSDSAPLKHSTMPP